MRLCRIGTSEETSFVLKNTKLPTFDEPEDLSDEDEKIKWKVRLWNQQVDRYGLQINTLEENLSALFSLMFENTSKILKAKLKSKKGFVSAERNKDIVWFLETLDDIILKFEETKPKLLAIDDQMELVMTMKQGNSTNEDFIKLMTKEVKVYTKHGGSFLWGKTQQLELVKRKTAALKIFISENSTAWTKEEETETEKLIRKRLDEEILAMAIMKRADKKRYGPLLKKLSNEYLLGNNNYPNNVADVLKLLNNYQPEVPTSGRAEENNSTTDTSQSTGLASSSTVSFLQTNGHQVKYLRGTNNSFFRNITCRFCGLKGHYQTHCPVVNSSGNPVGSGSSGGNANRQNSNSNSTTNEDNNSTQNNNASSNNGSPTGGTSTSNDTTTNNRSNDNTTTQA